MFVIGNNHGHFSYLRISRKLHGVVWISIQGQKKRYSYRKGLKGEWETRTSLHLRLRPWIFLTQCKTDTQRPASPSVVHGWTYSPELMFCNLRYNLKFLSSDFFTQNVVPFLTTKHKTGNFGKMPGTYACIISSVFKQKPWSHCMPRAITIFLFFQEVIKGWTLYMILI